MPPKNDQCIPLLFALVAFGAVGLWLFLFLPALIRFFNFSFSLAWKQWVELF
ncbi:MAG: hypothetical protein HY724_05700 [Candidatus Rokubacteria bacterium]|nr:hypothetical protein [Candidatus Rokubacteria bacterium]